MLCNWMMSAIVIVNVRRKYFNQFVGPMVFRTYHLVMPDVQRLAPQIIQPLQVFLEVTMLCKPKYLLTIYRQFIFRAEDFFSVIRWSSHRTSSWVVFIFISRVMFCCEIADHTHDLEIRYPVNDMCFPFLNILFCVSNLLAYLSPCQRSLTRLWHSWVSEEVTDWYAKQRHEHFMSRNEDFRW